MKTFFNTDVTGKVPVIAIFTKFDGLVNEAYTQLIDSELSHEGAEEKQYEKAQELLNNHFKERLHRARYPPSDNVQVDDMRVGTSNCNELIAKTANALTDDTLRLLFVSVQQNNVDLCIEYAVKYYFKYLAPSLSGGWQKLPIIKSWRKKAVTQNLMKFILAFFPHTWTITKVLSEYASRGID